MDLFPLLSSFFSPLCFPFSSKNVSTIREEDDEGEDEVINGLILKSEEDEPYDDSL